MKIAILLGIPECFVSTVGTTESEPVSFVYNSTGFYA